MNKIEYLPIFPTLIQVTKLDLNTDSIIEFCYEMKRQNKKGISKTNVGGWQSDNLINEVHSKEFSKLKTEIEAATNKYHSEINFKKKLKQELSDIWANINQKGNMNEVHTHPKSALSGTFYLTKGGAPILFQHPVTEMSQHYWEKYCVEICNPVNSDAFLIEPDPNLLLIFPPWALHKVSVNTEDIDRISLSFNTVFYNKQEGDK